MFLSPIADLHCDLLMYLEGGNNRTPYDAASRCSIPQLQAGLTKLQTMAVFVKTGNQSVQQGMAQVNIFKHLPLQYPKSFFHFNWQKDTLQRDKIAILLALEGASTFCYEDEPLSRGLERLKFIIEHIARPLYISFTWNMENRFGGGAQSPQVGLKEDGQHLLEFLHQKRIAVDFSHASDALAHDILNYIDKRKLAIPIIASHSNARTIANVPRNLPDEIAKEIIRRHGVIGINLYRHFIGPEANSYLIKHYIHWCELGAKNQVCFGADFFYEDDVPSIKTKEEPFFSQYANASCYGSILELFLRELKLTPQEIEGLAYKNFLSYLNRERDEHPR